MKYLLIICLLIGSIICEAQTNSIKRIPIDPNNLPIACTGRQGNHGHFVFPKAKSRNKLLNPAIFEVDFDRNMPPAAIAAFDYAVQILSENISSTIPIRITVYWEDLGENSLGGAGPSEYVKDFPNGPKSIAFPIALAEKIAQQPINSDRDADIFVDLNRNVDWFYDFDNPTSISATQFDFVSVALHELLHGIGFLGFAKVEARRGSLKSVLLYPDCTGNACHGPSIYDVYLTHLSESNLCEHFSDPSRALENALTDDNLFLLTSSFEEEVNLPKVYAPASFNLGASIYHLDQTTYEATPNSLMTPFIGTGEMEHDLGISLNVLYDLGWGSEMPTFTDILSPSIEHIPIRSIDDKTVGVPIEVIVEDLFSNVESVSIELVLNGVQQPTITSTRVFGDPFRSNVYTANIELPTPISPTDKLEYRIVAVDDSEQANKRTHPVEGFHTIVIEKTQAATITYLNDFNVVSNDFSGDGFSIDNPSEFGDAAIQSQHPYPNAEEGSISNLQYQLNTPIQIRAEDPLIEFEEVVLVEPGEPNTLYTDPEFWDYVIVEGRKLGDNSWHPFLEGYDSRAFDDWFTAYRNGTRFNNRNSTTDGTPNLFKTRVIDMTESGHFKTGDIVFIRFRLFSDSSVFGWGWAIDNLRIQDSSVAVEDYITQEGFQVFPNPVNNETITIHASFKKSVEDLHLRLYDNFGRLTEQRPLAINQSMVHEVVEMGHYPSGIYWVILQVDGRELLGKKILLE